MTENFQRNRITIIPLESLMSILEFMHQIHVKKKYSKLMSQFFSHPNYAKSNVLRTSHENFAKCQE